MAVWFVRVEVPMCIDAEDATEARERALRHVGEEADNCDDRHVRVVGMVTRAMVASLPYGWPGSIPWGADDERTVRQRVEGDQ